MVWSVYTDIYVKNAHDFRVLISNQYRYVFQHSYQNDADTNIGFIKPIPDISLGIGIVYIGITNIGRTLFPRHKFIYDIDRIFHFKVFGTLPIYIVKFTPLTMTDPLS